MADEYYLKFEKIGFYYEPITDTEWGAAGTTTTNYKQFLAVPGSIKVDPKVNTNILNMTGDGTILSRYDRVKVDSYGVLPTIAFEFYATPETFTPILVGAYQAVGEGATTPFGKTANPENGYVDFAGGEGYTFSIAAFNSSGDGVILKNAIVNTASLSISNSAAGEGRYAKCTVEFIGRTLSMSQNLTGSFTSTLPARIINNPTWGMNFTLNLTYPSSITDACWRNYTWSINNNVTSDCFTTSGVDNNYNRAPIINHVIDMVYNSSTYRYMKDYQDGANFNFVLKNASAISSDGNMSFAANYATLTGDPVVSINEKTGIILNLQEHASSTLTYAGISCYDAVEYGWT